MTIIQFFTSVIGSIWHGMEQITVPLLNIPVTTMLLGAFIAGISIQILVPLLGIGAGVVNESSLTFHKTLSFARHNAKVRSVNRYNDNLRKGRQADREVRDVNRWV